MTIQSHVRKIFLRGGLVPEPTELRFIGVLRHDGLRRSRGGTRGIGVSLDVALALVRQIGCPRAVRDLCVKLAETRTHLALGESVCVVEHKAYVEAERAVADRVCGVPTVAGAGSKYGVKKLQRCVLAGTSVALVPAGIGAFP